MIFVTVGTTPFQFNRLLEKIDELIENKKIKDRVVAQIGNSTYKPKHYDYLTFMTPKEFSKIINKSDLVISHAGAGSIITVLSQKKPLILVPRLKKFGEHTDNHQLQLTRELARQKRVIDVYDINRLENAIERIKKLSPKKTEKNKILELVEDFIKKVEK